MSFGYAAGGFRDCTRIASSDPAIWRNISLHNREAMEEYQTILDQLKKAIEEKDRVELQSIFSMVKTARDGFSE